MNQNFLEESVDTSRVAIYMAGAPASGKSEVVEHIKSTFGFIEINPDVFQELLQKPKITSDILTLKRLKNSIVSGKGIIINYTGKSGQYEHLITDLEDKYGYRSFMIYMWVDDINLLKKREAERAERIGRKVDDSYIREVFRSVQWNYKKYKTMFEKDKRGFFTFNAFYDMNGVEYTKQINLLYGQLNNWLSKKNVAKKESPKKVLRHIFASAEHQNYDEKMVDKIRAECSQIIGIYKTHGQYLYRGMKNVQYENIVELEYPKNRKPLDTNPKIQEMFINLFKKLGAVANRDNSIFCTTNILMSMNYGRPYIVFPKNDFHFMVTSIEDLYVNHSELIFSISKFFVLLEKSVRNLVEDLNKLEPDVFDLKFIPPTKTPFKAMILNMFEGDYIEDYLDDVGPLFATTMTKEEFVKDIKEFFDENDLGYYYDFNFLLSAYPKGLFAYILQYMKMKYVPDLDEKMVVTLIEDLSPKLFLRNYKIQTNNPNEIFLKPFAGKEVLLHSPDQTCYFLSDQHPKFQELLDDIMR